MPVDPAEGEFAHMVHAAFAEQAQGGPDPGRKSTFHRFVGVVEIDEQGLTIAGFHKAIGMSVEFFLQRLTFDIAEDVFGQDLSFKMRNRAGLEAGRLLASPSTKTFSYSFDCRVAHVGT